MPPVAATDGVVDAKLVGEGATTEQKEQTRRKVLRWLAGENQPAPPSARKLAEIFDEEPAHFRRPRGSAPVPLVSVLELVVAEVEEAVQKGTLADAAPVLRELVSALNELSEQTARTAKLLDERLR